MDDLLKEIQGEEARRKEAENLKKGVSKGIPFIEDKSLFPFKQISQSLIKEVTSMRDDKDIDLNFNLVNDYCPLKIFYKYVARKYPDSPTESMHKGLYFETKLLGSSARGKSFDIPPQKRRGLGIPVDYERINRQITTAKKIFFDNFLQITNVNVQVPMSVYHPKFDIIVTMEMDIFPTPVLHNDELKLSIVDLKLTKDTNNTRGAFCWGSPEYMDHIQADLYTFFCNWVYSSDKAMERCKQLNPGFNYDYIFSPNMVKMIRKEPVLFYYFVFGYTENSSNALEDQYKILHRDPSQEKEYNMVKRLCYSIELLKEDERKGWQSNPSEDNCKNCLLKNTVCNKFNEIKTI